jgi:hypothetical protein
MDNKAWQAKLAQNYKKENSQEKRNIKLPSKKYIDFDGETKHIKVTLKKAAVVANMQSSGAAFEAWILALNRWCGVQSVELDWEMPDPKIQEARHYQRFLYRAERFAQLFEWVKISPSKNLKGSAFHKANRLILNVSGGPTSSGTSSFKSEAFLEKQIIERKALEQKFKLTSIDRQFPVGLFKDNVAQGNEIFTASKSAIDLIGTDAKKCLWLFELKAAGNEGLGIISELLFYVSVMQDTIRPLTPDGTRKKFEFASLKPGARSTIDLKDILECERIEAHFLAREFHPLLDEKIVALLNRAMNKGDVPAHFQITHLNDIGMDIPAPAS